MTNVSLETKSGASWPPILSSNKHQAESNSLALARTLITQLNSAAEHLNSGLLSAQRNKVCSNLGEWSKCSNTASSRAGSGSTPVWFNSDSRDGPDEMAGFRRRPEMTEKSVWEKLWGGVDGGMRVLTGTERHAWSKKSLRNGEYRETWVWLPRLRMFIISYGNQ